MRTYSDMPHWFYRNFKKISAQWPVELVITKWSVQANQSNHVPWWVSYHWFPNISLYDPSMILAKNLSVTRQGVPSCTELMNTLLHWYIPRNWWWDLTITLTLENDRCQFVNRKVVDVDRSSGRDREITLSYTQKRTSDSSMIYYLLQQKTIHLWASDTCVYLDNCVVAYKLMRNVK